jgi:hypothetical protein
MDGPFETISPDPNNNDESIEIIVGVSDRILAPAHLLS